MQDFIEVFYSYRDGETPYHAIVWCSGAVVEVEQHEGLAPLVTSCTRHALPVVCTDDQIRKQLRLCGIAAQEPRSRRKETATLVYGSVLLEEEN
jgi:hypothetical protein